MEVKIIEDSISEQGIRLTTLHLRYWRAIHAEFMTHRVFSRNARSSRAVPVMTLLTEDIFIPQFGMNQKGMQSTEAASAVFQEEWEREWCELAEITRKYVRKWGAGGMHKQWANRPLEWFGWIDVLVTSTDWSNFFALRDHMDAQPEFGLLAAEMGRQMDLSTPLELRPGQWHLPYITGEERNTLELTDLVKLSTARCARLSYKPFDGNADWDAELERFNKLVVSQPVHASPSEHQATPDRPLSLRDSQRQGGG